MDTILDKIEARVLANCNRELLQRNKDCGFCHLVFDCKYYTKETGIDLCEFLNLELEKKIDKGEKKYV